MSEQVLGTAAAPAPSEDEIFAQARRGTLQAIVGMLTIGTRRIYGEAGKWNTLAQAQAEVDKFGAQAAALFQCSGLLTQALAAATGTAPAVMPPWFDYSANADGSVTLRQISEVPPVIVGGNG